MTQAREIVAPIPYREDGWEVVDKSTGGTLRTGLTFTEARDYAERPVRKGQGAGTPDKIFTVAVDLHGTLADHWKDGIEEEIGEPLKGAKEAMQAFKDAGYRTVINSVYGKVDAIREWLDKHGIPCDYINESPWGNDTESSGKIDADVYVDDRGMHFKGDWDHTAKKVDDRAKREMKSIDKRLTRKSWATTIAEAYRNDALVEMETAADYAELHGVTDDGQLDVLPTLFAGSVSDRDAWNAALKEIQSILIDRFHCKAATLHDAGPSIGR